MLILDVKGNFYKQVVKFAEEAGRQKDVIVIELGGAYKYNPVYKPNLRPLVLANRSKTVLSLFSPRGASDGYWIDKAELLIAECIKLSRLYNSGYTTFVEINKLVNNKTYLDMRISETININTSREYVFDEKLFTQKLDVFTGICFLSDGSKILEPTVVHLQPYFSDTIKNGIQTKKMQ